MTERALLIQAKTANLGRTSLSGKGDLKQRYMYVNWPKFHIATGKCKGPASKCKRRGRKYDVKAEGVLGTRYALVEESAQPSWLLESSNATWSPTKKSGKAKLRSFADVSAVPVTARLSKGEALEEMINKSLGYEVKNTPARDDWSDVISALVENALASFQSRLFNR